jgi:hypothetical protein
MLENRTQRARSPGDVGRCRRQAPGYRKQSGIVRVTEWAARCISHPRIAVPLSSGRTGPVAERAECGTGMVASAPRVDMGPGLPANAYRKCRTATSHDELSRSLCFVSPWVVLDAAFSSGGCVHFHLPVYTCRSNRVCAHTEARPALTQVVSKRRKLHCRFLDNASRD